MKAIRIERYGGPGELALAEVALPQPRAGEVRVKMHYAGVNFTDIYRREGKYPVELPGIPGAEASGVVTDIGGSRDKAALARDCGADHVILYREADFCAEVRRLSGGRGVDIVYDTVGRDTFAGSLGALAVRGTLVLVGNASGPVESVDPMALAEAGSVSLVRPHMQHYVRTPEEYARRAREVLALAAEGVLRVTVDRVLPLAQAADAQRALAARETRGKILLAIGE